MKFLEALNNMKKGNSNEASVLGRILVLGHE